MEHAFHHGLEGVHERPLQDLRYAAENNFTGEKIYHFDDAFLRYGTLKKLMLVQQELEQSGLCLVIWDAFRPVSAQYALWESCPDARYVANPISGTSSHCRGSTVDVTLADANGNELPMPSAFDEFSALADRDYSDCDSTAAANAQLLERTMGKYGFQGYSNEWWHYADTDSYTAEKTFEPQKRSLGHSDSQDIDLYAEARADSAVLAKIPKGTSFSILAQDGDFAYIYAEECYGYVLQSLIVSREEAKTTLASLFSQALNSDGAETEALAYELRREFEREPYRFARELSRLDLAQIDTIAQLVIYEYPASERNQIWEILDGISDRSLAIVLSSFSLYLR